MTRASIALGLLAVFSWAPDAMQARPARRARRASTPVVKVEMRNVRLHMTDHVALNVRSLKGTFVSTRPGGIPNLDGNSKRDAFRLPIAEAGPDALSAS